VKPLRWVTDSALQVFKARADEVARHWAAAWGVPAIRTAAICLSASFDPAAAQQPWKACDGQTAAWTRSGAALAEDVARMIFGEVPQASALASEIGARAAAALAQELAQALRCSTAGDHAPAVDERLPGHWGARYACWIGKSQFEIALGMHALQALGWIKRPAPRPLLQRALEQAIEQVPVALTIELGHAELTLRDLTTLAIGDVVLTSERASVPLRVAAPSGQTLMNGLLGSADQHRALQLTVPAPQ